MAGFKKEADYNISELGHWNVAADFSKLKIMKPLYLCDIYENLAKFGYDSVLDQLVNYSIPKDEIRIIGFERLIHELLRLIKNAKFAMKTKGTKEEIEGYEKRLKRILSIFPLVHKTVSNRVKNTKQTRIEEEKFNKVLDIVLEIKSDINTPLNRNHLIFTDKEEFDPIEYKKQIMKQVTTRG